jgi:hypothetical protein
MFPVARKEVACGRALDYFMLELSLRRGPEKITAFPYVRYNNNGQKQIWELPAYGYCKD